MHEGLWWSRWCDLFCLWEWVRRKERAVGGGASGKLRRSFAWRLPAALEQAGLRMTNLCVRYCLCLLRESAAGWLAGGGFVVCGVEDYAAVEAFAVAFGAEVGLLAQGEVDNAALARGHGSEVERGSGLANFFGGDTGGHPEFLEADGTLILAVEGNLFVLGGR